MVGNGMEGGIKGISMLRIVGRVVIIARMIGVAIDGALQEAIFLL